MAKHKSKFLEGKRIDPAPISSKTSVADLIDEAFLAYNAARLREACQLFTKKMLEPDVTVGMSLTGALTPAGLGISALIPLIKAGFIDWIISTGANLYHDTHFGIGLKMHLGMRRRRTSCCGRKRSCAFTTSFSTIRCCSIPIRFSAR